MRTQLPEETEKRKEHRKKLSVQRKGSNFQKRKEHSFQNKREKNSAYGRKERKKAFSRK